jgi:hypothetical protein
MSGATVKRLFLGDPAEISTGARGQICHPPPQYIPSNRKLRRSNSEAGGKLAQIFEKCLKKQLKTYEIGIFWESQLKTNGS